MPPAAVAAVPAVIGGLSLLDQKFGSGKDARDMQRQALNQQNQLAQAQLPDIQRRTELNQWLEDQLKRAYAAPGKIPQFADLDGVFQQYYPDKKLMDNDFFASIAPGIQSKAAFDQLGMLGGNVGTGGIHGFANQAVGLGENRRGEFQDTVAGIVQQLLMQNAMKQQQAMPPTSAINPGGLSDPFGSFFGFRG